MDPRPNILLITSDQQRTDTLGVYGSRIARTPRIDRLCERGVVFERAYTQNPVCIPSRACIQTGRYTHQHGVRYMESIIDNTPGLPPWELTFMERLQAAGYETGATGKIHMMPERGFDFMEICGGKGQRWTQVSGQDIGPAPLGGQYRRWLEARSPGAYERIYAQRRRPEYKAQLGAIVNDLPLEHYIETYILESSLDFIARPRDKPFFLWCGFCGPHGPCDPPASHAGLYPIDDMPLPELLGADVSDRPPFLRRHSRPDLGEREGGRALRRFIAYYYALVTLIDDYVGRLVDALDQRGLLDNTLILYVSDHGEMLGNFGMMGKGNFYEPVLRVPLFAVPPGGCGAMRVGGVTETMAIAPTILDYAGVERPPQMQASSLRSLLEGAAAAPDAKPLGALSEYTSNDQRMNGKCLVTERFKYALWDGGEGGEFYDLRNDPQERRNLWRESAQRDERERHAQLLLERLMASERPYAAGREAPY